MSITATSEQQRQLLDLQALDSQRTRVRNQLNAIRHDDQLGQLRRDGASSVQRGNTMKAQVDEHQFAVQQAEHVVTETTKRRNDLQSRVDADDVSSRDIQALTTETAELTIRIEQLENDQVTAMQTLEESQPAREQAETNVTEAEQAVNARITTLNEQGQQLSKQGKELTAERAAITNELPTDLVTEYEQLRDHNQGIGAMELRADGLSGAGLPIAPAELAAINNTPANELAYCPDTGAILVRN